MGVLLAAVRLDKRTFGNDADGFRPTPWIEADDEKLRIMKATHMGFSRGDRGVLEPVHRGHANEEGCIDAGVELQCGAGQVREAEITS
jgi:hypothetical protein